MKKPRPRITDEATGRAIEWTGECAVTAALLRTILRLDDEGKLGADGVVSPGRLRTLLGCEHGPGPMPCGACLGTSDEAEQLELDEHARQQAARRRRPRYLEPRVRR